MHLSDTNQFPELYAYFGISSASALDLDDITNTLGIEPTRKSVRGSRNSSPPVPRRNGWVLETERQRTIDAEPLIAHLVKTLDGQRDALGVLQQRYPEAEFGLTAVAYIVVPDGVTPAIILSAELLSRIAALRLFFTVSLYLIGTDADGST